MPDREFIIITGLSGAGKSLAIKCFEDLDFFCVDNLLPALIPKFAQLCASSSVRRVAVVIDVRGREFLPELHSALKDLPSLGFMYRIVYLEASDAVLVRRFSETRRKHPLASSGRILKSIHDERTQLQELKSLADKIFDTTYLTPNQLKKELTLLFFPESDKRPIDITLVSFGYKFGIPLDADLVFDVRFLPNPYYVESLQNLTGNNEAVREYIMKWPETAEFLDKLRDFLKFLVPQFIKEGKTHLTIAIGCTGGRHRSIAVAVEMARYLQKLKYKPRLEHRDLKRGVRE